MENQDLAHLSIQKAVDIAGGQTALARLIGEPVTQPHVYTWLKRDKRASVKYVAKISQVTGIPCHELRPDIFPATTANDSTSPQDAA